MDAAVEVLVRGGREAVNLEEILASTRTSKGQLFYYFPGGKQELIRAATERQIQRFDAGSAEQLDSFETWGRWIEGIIELHRKQSQDGACEFAALAGRVLDDDPEERKLLGASFSSWHGQLTAGIDAMKKSGSLRADADASALAGLFLTTLQGGAVIDKATGSLMFVEASLRAAFAYFSSFAAAEPAIS